MIGLRKEQAVLALLACAATGCLRGTLHIVSEPPDVFVKVNNKNLGMTPVDYEYDLGDVPAFTVTGQREGYFPESVVVTEESPFTPPNLLSSTSS